MPGARLVALALALLAAPARAGTVGVVVTGDPGLQVTLTKQLEGWLRGHGHVIGDALPADMINTLLNCMLIDDQGCARGVVEAQARTDAVLFGQASRSRSSNSTIVTVYWIAKGKEPVGMRRPCEDCNDDLMRSTLDEILPMVVSASQVARGRLSLRSRPEGMTVLLDNVAIGVTPLDREVPAGPHTIVLMHRGTKVGERALKIHPDVTAEITIPVTLPVDPPAPAPARSRFWPGLALGVGGAAIATGVVFFVTSEVDDGSKPTYHDTRPLGIGLAAGGAVVAGLGAWLWLRGGAEPRSGPVAALDQQGGMLGWAGAF